MWADVEECPKSLPCFSSHFRAIIFFHFLRPFRLSFCILADTLFDFSSRSDVTAFCISAPSLTCRLRHAQSLTNISRHVTAVSRSNGAKKHSALERPHRDVDRDGTFLLPCWNLSIIVSIGIVLTAKRIGLKRAPPNLSRLTVTEW